MPDLNKKAPRGSSARHNFSDQCSPIDHAPARRVLELGYLALGVAIGALFLAAVYPISRPHPSSDDWTYANAVGLPWTEFAAWIFAQHVDHRIPIIKGVQYLILWATRFDFRALILLNFAVAALGVHAYFRFARLYRGQLAFGDFIAPLILLNLSFGLFGWAFSAQFSFSIALALAFLPELVLAQQQASRGRLAFAMAILLACGLCGMNGLVLAYGTACVLLLALICGPKLPMRRATFMGVLLVLAVLTAVAFTWTPSETSSSMRNLDLPRLGRWLVHLAKSSFVIDAIAYGDWLSIACVVLVLAGLISGLARGILLLQGRLALTEVAPLAVFAGVLVLLVVVAIGRSGTAEWSPGLEMHYGYLASPVILLSWLTISNRLPRGLISIVGILWVAMAAHAFYSGAVWRLAYLKDNHRIFVLATQAIASQDDANTVTDRHIKDFYYVDIPATRREVANGISKLRTIGRPLYETTK